MGNYYKTEHGIGMINWGRVGRPDPTFTVIDSMNNVMANLYWEDDWVSYRSYADSLPLISNRPTITCSETGGIITLTASLANSYLWSTGETTQSITVSGLGTYMVWEPHGVGFLDHNRLFSPI